MATKNKSLMWFTFVAYIIFLLNNAAIASKPYCISFTEFLNFFVKIGNIFVI